MSFINIFAKQSRVFLNPVLRQCTAARNIFTDITPSCFRITDALFGEPLKKKKKLDPAIIKQRQERKRRKIEKQIRRLEKHARQLKPIGECEIPFKLVEEQKQRTREPPKLTPEILEERALLFKDWCRYKHHQYVEDLETTDTIILSQKKALEELKAESVDLYNAALELDLSLMSYEAKGPTFTPPIPNYQPPDGDYFDVTKKYEGE
ncbi:39S ribosomal protein L40, mitochondrial [Microplitis mediator]|uniref:39S ribosomal protein L40, mitochondrial n=1 Tax=Microplitis mediator TaxID=375433 RepID=UPI00255666E4|nr:39S ribosomal protein L40, mitochondrial [Microplitis mediator]